MAIDESPRIAILDDVDAAVAALSDLGKAALANCCRVIRRELLLLAAVQRWRVVEYHEFADWALSGMPDMNIWVVLDPLFPAARSASPTVRVRYTRVFSNGEIVARPSGWSGTPGAVSKQETIGIIDDGVLTGGTLVAVIRDLNMVRPARAPVEIRVCISTAAGRKAIQAFQQQGTAWRQYVEGDFVPIHLRDVLPLLPFSGRPVELAVPFIAPQHAIPVRFPATAFGGGAWGLVSRNRSFMAAARDARATFVADFARLLGRPPVVRDVCLLSADSAVWSVHMTPLQPEMPLANAIL